jgi:hypothetical protein
VHEHAAIVVAQERVDHDGARIIGRRSASEPAIFFASGLDETVLAWSLATRSAIRVAQSRAWPRSRALALALQPFELAACVVV